MENTQARLQKLVLNPMAGGIDYSNVPALPPDPIFHTKTAYKQDPDPRKLNLGVGAYRDDNLKPYVLAVVKKAEQEILSDLMDGKTNKEYLPIGGDAEFVGLSQKLILGDSPQLANNCVAGVQSMSGTGSLRVLGEFSKLFFPNCTIWLSNPTWGNHKKIFRKAGLNQKMYRYWNAAQRNLDFNGMCADLNTASRGDVVLLHACAHNPTGVDPTQAQWNKIADICESRGLLALFDSAYQGYGSGDLVQDRYAVELFAKRGLSFMIAQSYSKNLGLYGERVGCASVVCKSAAAAKNVQSQLCGIVRPMWSNPPKHGCYIVKKILNDPTLYKEWQIELKFMVRRILSMRSAIRKGLEGLNTPGTWNHITDQIGMFSFTGLTADQVMYVRNKYHIYMLKSGRISIAGLSTKTVDYFNKAVDEAIRNA